jgi:tetrapyrrole methylase family protein/MazG family protein
MVDFQCKSRYGWEDLLEIMRLLRAPGGCPWDAEQTHATIRRDFLEETYETLDAIDREDPVDMCEELGDMLLQVLLHAEIAKKYGDFDIGDVITAIGEKMVSRHSHIFGSDEADGSDEVTDLWTKNKMAERGQTTYTESMKDVARSLPATLRASKLLKRLEGACRMKDSLEDAVRAAKSAVETVGCASDAEQAVGDALLKLVAAARAANVDPEIALNTASDRMIDRFEKAESEVLKAGKSFDSIDEKMLRDYYKSVKLLSKSE